MSDHTPPQDGCRCRVCIAFRARWWRSLSCPKQIALFLADFVLPVHEGYARIRFRVRGNTIDSLLLCGLLRRIYLAEPYAPHLATPFLVRTQRGDELLRDGRRP